MTTQQTPVTVTTCGRCGLVRYSPGRGHGHVTSCPQCAAPPQHHHHRTITHPHIATVAEAYRDVHAPRWMVYYRRFANESFAGHVNAPEAGVALRLARALFPPRLDAPIVVFPAHGE